jgi:hypothetical protein
VINFAPLRWSKPEGFLFLRPVSHSYEHSQLSWLFSLSQPLANFSVTPGPILARGHSGQEAGTTMTSLSDPDFLMNLASHMAISIGCFMKTMHIHPLPKRWQRPSAIYLSGRFELASIQPWSQHYWKDLGNHDESDATAECEDDGRVEDSLLWGRGTSLLQWLTNCLQKVQTGWCKSFVKRGNLNGVFQRV